MYRFKIVGQEEEGIINISDLLRGQNKREGLV